LYRSFKDLYGFLTESLAGDPSLERRRQLVVEGEERLRFWLDRSYRSGEVRRFMGKVERGFEYWFTFLLVSGLSLPIMWRSVRCVSWGFSVKSWELC
jgi:hypothetical protein